MYDVRNGYAVCGQYARVHSIGSHKCDIIIIIIILSLLRVAMGRQSPQPLQISYYVV